MINFVCHACHKKIELDIQTPRKTVGFVRMHREIQQAICPKCNKKVYSAKSLIEELKENQYKRNV